MGVEGAGFVRPHSLPSATPPAIELTRFHILRPSHDVIVPAGAISERAMEMVQSSSLPQE
jgi:hypothetical protein